MACPAWLLINILANTNFSRGALRPLPWAAWLPTLIAGVVAALLHAPAMPLAWNAVVAAFAVGAILQLTGVVRFSRFVAAVAALGAFLAIVPIFGTTLGQESAFALLAATFWLKGWESATPRDLRAWGLTAILLLATAFVRSQSPLYAGAVLAGFLMVLIGWGQTTRAEWGLIPQGQDLAPLARRTLVLFAAVTPLVILLFLVVPRLERPLWGIPQDAAKGKSGLSETMRPGALSALALSDGIALTLTWEGDAPLPADLYFRALTLTHFDGSEWRPDPNSPVTEALANRAPLPAAPLWVVRPTPLPDVETRRFTLLLAPQPTRWLPMPEHTVALDGAKSATPTADGLWVSHLPLVDRTLWHGSAQVSDRAPAPLSAAQFRALTLLPQGSDPRAQALGRTIAAQHATAAERLAAIEAAFRAAELRYTLTPPLMAKDAADTTLFDARAGFCEHFAHAFTVVARSAGLPTRVVLGYQGATLNPVDQSWVVRHADAHAWAEVWLDGEWRRVDPTRWVAPDRVLQGSTTALRGEKAPLRAAWLEQPWFKAIRYQLWAWQRRWDLWVVGFDADRQRSLWERLGWRFDQIGWPTALLTLLIVVALAVPLVVRLPEQERDPVRRAWLALERSLASRGLARKPGEAPNAFVARVTAQLPEPVATRLTVAATAYHRYRFGHTEWPAQKIVQELRAVRRALRGPRNATPARK